MQAFLTHLLTVDLPKLMVLPKRLEINIPPAVTAVAEAAVGRDVVMRAVASAVLQADALENALIAALPLGPQSAAGGVSLPASFQGELQVSFPILICSRCRSLTVCIVQAFDRHCVVDCCHICRVRMSCLAKLKVPSWTVHVCCSITAASMMLYIMLWPLHIP